ncbi:MAG: terminase family protein [Pseudomonadota bacterium]
MRGFLDGLSPNALAAMPWLWELWAHPAHQLPPAGDWQTWVVLGGRGAGKTRAGAEWVRAQVEGSTPLAPGRCRRICLLGETLEEARAVMVEGESGLVAVTPPDRKPDWRASQHKLVWPNGAEAQVVSAANPESLRGPQFDGAWCDELAKWRRGREAWEMLQFCLRLPDRDGAGPRQVVTTTPRDVALLREILEATGTAVTRAATAANRAHLAPGFVERLEARHGGTWLGRQELEGEMVEGREGALWQPADLEAARVAEAPALDRVVVAVDPPVSATGDECGIVVAGVVDGDGPGRSVGYVIADESLAGASPQAWAEAAVAAYELYGADRLVAEVNQGGDLVEQIIRQVAPGLSYRAVHASRGKRMRAEPVAALYEQGRVHHVGALPALETQMTDYVGSGPAGGARSPDRLDALVWALTDLMLREGPAAPRVRRL